ncbi:mannose-1-phosphate guanylyltransferase/mannose-1-phosphate guanylyltransferase/mannose-6-phosphate isomerase [Sphingomonas jejuensis]|uniref:Mannose-1-phosphate guanylyltransferase/mannose-1-phosphate guanylyltransferase/mannose-6-phosphate isomerase n=1 Tax=Sphingomonas jejuensis TaxID=904715 RepID=A0ABX0XPJ4_9SPHN|nr:mannose-1-phosphate guanylyltransferase/mannose-6-phosphate isomerase [Sphingomonas jejuensis]NJC34611.1 mannose-1-phosphate guanylyltransferase/mannose-1-phosphate guanylyltransferase/mannose-6-phosphate isomerase [Sphingomonas jejuensis]
MSTTIITPVILSGGSGTRLWPMSRPERPKQMLSLTAAETMLQLTALRTRDEARFASPLVVANAAHADAITEQLQHVGIAPAALILEPKGRNTAPAIALAAVEAGDRPMLVMPSDHVIDDVPAFHRAIEAALPMVEAGWLVTFGISPTGPETGYGYIQIGAEIGAGVHRVERFVEKPARERAQAMLDAGDHAWNGGIFLFKGSALLEALDEHAPAIRAAADAAMAAARRDGARIYPDADRFGQSPSESIDIAVMERADRVAVVPVAMGWSDVGSWDALHALGPHDASGNAIGGEVIAIDAENCLIRTDGPTVAAVGVSDLIIVASADKLLILPRGRSQDVKKIVEALEARR